MIIDKVIVVNGYYKNRIYNLLISFSNNKPIDIINIDKTSIGFIFEATVQKVLSNVDGVILNLPNGETGFTERTKLDHAFFTRYQSTKNMVSQGDKFYVEITQDKKEKKPFSCRQIKTKNVCPNNSYSTIVKTYLDTVKYDGQVLSNIKLENIQCCMYTDATISLWALYDVSKILDNSLKKQVYLANGSNILIECLSTATFIDINSATSKMSFLEINIEAVEEIFHQIRLRNISGIIIIDFLKMNKEEQTKLFSIIKSKITEDINYLSLYGFTKLGMYELTRSKTYSVINQVFDE